MLANGLMLCCFLLISGMATTSKVPMGNQQHLTMYIGFGLTGLMAVLIHHEIKFLPKGRDGLNTSRYGWSCIVDILIEHKRRAKHHMSGQCCLLYLFG